MSDNNQYFDLFFFKVAGISYYDVTLALFKKLRKNDEIILKAEPENPYDDHAVAVYWGVDPSKKLGYVPRHQNEIIHNLLKNTPDKITAFIKTIKIPSELITVTVRHLL